jgi:hypothetical protein
MTGDRVIVGNFELEEASRRSSGELSDLIGALKSRAPRVALAIATAQAARPVIKRGKAWVDAHMRYEVHVAGDDEMYNHVHRWVLGLVPRDEQRALIAFADRQPRDGKWVRDLGLRYDGRHDSIIKVDGHQVHVAISEGRFEKEGSEGGAWKPPELALVARSAAGRDAVITHLHALVTGLDNDKHRPVIKMFGEWGWESLSESPVRALDSVILPLGQTERIVADMQRFLGAEAEYVRRGIPWHRGYLFEGPPRTGKTSIAKALAGHFGMDLWYMPLGDVRRDGELLKKVAQVQPRSVLLLEDLDVFYAATERDEGSGMRATLAGLLNATDGAATPHGLIIIMTSNNPELLNSALVQPGRVDRREHFGLCDINQSMRIISHYYDTSRRSIDHLRCDEMAGISPAEVMEACKCSDSPAGAVRVIVNDHLLAPAVHRAPWTVDVQVQGEVL